MVNSQDEDGFLTDSINDIVRKSFQIDTPELTKHFPVSIWSSSNFMESFYKGVHKIQALSLAFFFIPGYCIKEL